MAVSSTTFAQRMDKISSGKTTSWTVPGEGLAELRDERSFLAKANVKMQAKSTQKKTSILLYLVALLAGALSVVASRWVNFTYLDRALSAAAEKGVDAASVFATIPTVLILAVMLSGIAMLVFRLRKQVLPVQTAGFMGAFVFEADLVALAPQVYAKFYPPAWVADMLASATLVT